MERKFFVKKAIGNRIKARGAGRAQEVAKCVCWDLSNVTRGAKRKKKLRGKKKSGNLNDPLKRGQKLIMFTDKVGVK